MARKAETSYQGPDRRATKRRDEDFNPVERIKAVEKKQEQGSRDLRRHLKDCTQARQETKAALSQTNSKVGELLTKQDAQTEILTDLSQLLPWLKENHRSSKRWNEMWNSIGSFFVSMARKNWDSISGKLIIYILGGIAIYKGVPWKDVVKFLIP